MSERFAELARRMTDFTGADLRDAVKLAEAAYVAGYAEGRALTPKQKLDALLGDRPVPRVLPEDVQNL